MPTSVAVPGKKKKRSDEITEWMKKRYSGWYKEAAAQKRRQEKIDKWERQRGLLPHRKDKKH